VRGDGFPLSISPHQLRHIRGPYARLADPAAAARSGIAGGAGGELSLILGDPLQQVQRLLGHASLTTTYIYLDHIATRADTVDAVEELLALLPGPQGA
jgi:integrase